MTQQSRGELSEVLTLKSSRSSSTLTLSGRKPATRAGQAEYVRVRLEAREIKASSARVYLHDPHDFVSFFDELASNWQGWAGAKEWASVEGDFSISATSDSSGHVALRITLKSGPYESDWSVNAVIHVDAGQLERLAEEVRLFSARIGFL